MKRAIIVGASSGIGRELAKVLSQDGYVLGLSGRRVDLLDSLQLELPTTSHTKQMDVSNAVDAIQRLEDLITQLGGLDLLVISAGIGFINGDLEWAKEEETIDVNVAGFAAIANVGIRHFIREASGHLVAISSIAALRGNGAAPAYNASKAFVSNYLEGLRHKVRKLKLPITVTDVQPGFVATAMAKGEGLFWVATPEKAAQQIRAAILRKKNHAYVTKRWRIIAWLFKALPDALYQRL